MSANRDEVELILVNDGSLDSTHVICCAYALEYPETIQYISKQNGGVSSARNIGLSHVRGEWIAFVDADDMLMPGSLEVLIEYANRDDVELLQFGLTRGTHTGNVTTSVMSPEQYVKSGLCQVCAGGTLVRNNIIRDNNICFDEEISLAEDQLFIMQAITHCSRVKRIQEVLYFYRSNADSATNHPKSSSLLKSIDKLIDFKMINPMFSSIINRTLLSFNYLLVLINEESLQDIKKVYIRSSINSCNRVSKGAMLFYRLSHFNFNFAALLVRFLKSKY